MELTLFIVVLLCCFSLVLSDGCGPPVINVYGGSCESISSKLDAMSIQLANIESKLNGPGFSEWEVVFRANSGAGGPNLLDLWKGTTTLNDDDPDAKQVDGSFVAPYKSALVEQWGALDIKKVKFAFYDDGIEVMTLIFNGIGSNKMNWFSNEHLLQTPYPDMLTSTFNYFAVDPKIGTCPRCRMWYISNIHNACPGDAGWVAVTSLEVCAWDRAAGAAPRFIYSSRNTVNVWESDSPASASVMAISIQTAV